MDFCTILPALTLLSFTTVSCKRAISNTLSASKAEGKSFVLQLQRLCQQLQSGERALSLAFENILVITGSACLIIKEAKHTNPTYIEPACKKRFRKVIRNSQCAFFDLQRTKQSRDLLTTHIRHLDIAYCYATLVAQLTCNISAKQLNHASALPRC
jgi:hypothetical protein